MKFTRIAIALMLLLSLFSVTAFAAVTMPTDISGHWAQASIEDFVTKGYVVGYTDGTFKPDNKVTRAEFMKMVNATYGFTVKAEISYTDVKAADWFYEEVAKAKAAGYISGYEDNTMRPNDFISRQEVASILKMLKKFVADPASVDTFTDKGEIAAWAKDSVGAVVKAGAMVGYPDKTFQPKRFLTRAEAVTVLRGSLTIALGDVEVPLAAPVIPAATGGGGGGGGGSTPSPSPAPGPVITPKTINTSGIAAVFADGTEDKGTITGNEAQIVFTHQTGPMAKVRIDGTNDAKITLTVTSYNLGNNGSGDIPKTVVFTDMSNIDVRTIFDAKDVINISSIKALTGSRFFTIKGILTGPTAQYTSRPVTLVMDMDKVVPGYADKKENTLTYRSGAQEVVYIQKGKEGVKLSDVGLTSIITVSGENQLPDKISAGAYKNQVLLSILDPAFMAQKEQIKQAIATACGRATWGDVILSDLVAHSGDIAMKLDFPGDPLTVVFAYMPN